MSSLLDTSIIIDLLRSHPPAISWLSQQRPMEITRVTWLEVIEGVTDLPSQVRALNLLKRFDIVEFTVSDMTWATDQLIKYCLGLNVDAFDCLIAATSYRLRIPLYTINLKHFTPLIGKLA